MRTRTATLHLRVRKREECSTIHWRLLTLAPPEDLRALCWENKERYSHEDGCGRVPDEPSQNTVKEPMFYRIHVCSHAHERTHMHTLHSTRSCQILSSPLTPWFRPHCLTVSSAHFSFIPPFFSEVINHIISSLPWWKQRSPSTSFGWVAGYPETYEHQEMTHHHLLSKAVFNKMYSEHTLIN